MSAEFTEARGRQLAVEMMRELTEKWLNSADLESVPDAELNEATIGQEPEVMRRYLGIVQRSGSAALERGFLCVLSDFIGCSHIAEIDIEQRYRRRRGA